MKDSLPDQNFEMSKSELEEMQAFGKLMNAGYGSRALRQMDQRFSAMKTLDRWERTMLLGANLYTKDEDGEEKERDEDDPNIQIELARVLNSDMQQALRISRTLRTLSGLSNPSFQRWQSKPDGDETAFRRMKSLGEMSHLRASAYAFLRTQPRLFRHKLLNNAFTVRERGINRDYKQLLYVLVDGSGSMQGVRVAMASGALLNRLRSVVKGDAQLYYRMFDGSPGPEHEALDPKGGFEAVKYVLEGHTYSGGGTDIDYALKEAVKSITQKMEDNPDLVKPEILLVTDGEDSVCTTVEELQGITCHAIMCQTGTHDTARKLCRETGGIYVHVD